MQAKTLVDAGSKIVERQGRGGPIGLARENRPTAISPEKGCGKGHSWRKSGEGRSHFFLPARGGGGSRGGGRGSSLAVISGGGRTSGLEGEGSLRRNFRLHKVKRE